MVGMPLMIMVVGIGQSIHGQAGYTWAQVCSLALLISEEMNSQVHSARSRITSGSAVVAFIVGCY